jgi:[pyruvate, water dikinase]-phosphate phosphotransferase / [pyruvate, water dikinase] kinase
MAQIFVASDGTGRTAEQAVQAALTQFDREHVEIRRFSEIRSKEQIRHLVMEAQKASAFIVHTLVTDKLRELLLKSARIHNVETIDLMGPLLDRLSDHLATHPSEQPGLFSHLDESYFRRIETMQFAFNHDDGKRVEELKKAEIVLVGVSRTFKTPLSIYLAFKRWYVANVPIVLGFQVPDILFEIPPERVFCLNTYPNRLAQLRRARQDRLGGTIKEYADPEYVRKECRYASDIFLGQPGWQKINVTSKSIEEIASEIITLLPKKMDEDNETSM